MKELFLQTILAFLAINFCGILRLAVSFFLCYIIIAKPLAERRFASPAARYRDYRNFRAVSCALARDTSLYALARRFV